MTRRHKWICANWDVQNSSQSQSFQRLISLVQELRIGSSLKMGVIASVVLPGCALLPSQRSTSRPATSHERVSQLEKILKQQRGTIEEMREKNLVLEQRLRKSSQARASNGMNASLRSTSNLSPKVGAKGSASVVSSSSSRATAVAQDLARQAQRPMSENDFHNSSRVIQRSKSALASQQMPNEVAGLDADEIVPIPFTPSAAGGFDLDMAKSPQPLRPSPVDASETSQVVAIARPSVAQDFLPMANQDSSEVSSHRPGIGSDDLSFALRSNKKTAAAPPVIAPSNVPVNIPVNNSVTAPVASVSPADERFAASSGGSGEHFLYSKVVNSYREHKIAELTKASQLLLKSYPDSVFADNSLYLCGLLSFEMNAYPEAERYMNRVIREFPQGNKVVGAVFAKAMIAKKLRKFDQTESILKQVARTFPGSPEAGRVTFELKLLKVAQAGRIREL